MEQDSDSTVTSLGNTEENLCDNPTRDTLAEGLISLFQPVVDQLDERVRSTRYNHLILILSLTSSQNRISISVWHNKIYRNNWTI